MIGDSLHTDVLGGLASGISTVLVTNHGLFKNHDYQKEILRTKFTQTGLYLAFSMDL